MIKYNLKLPSTAITAIFSSPISDSSINSIIFRVEGEGGTIPGDVVIKNANKTLEFRAQSPLNFGMTYWVTIEGAKEQTSIVLEKKKWRFETRPSRAV